MVYKNYHGSLCIFCRSIICIAHVVKFALRGIMLPFEIRAIVPSYFNDYAVRRDFPLTAFSTCTPLCRRAKICLYLRHRAFRSEQSRHGWKDYYRSFALTKNSKYVKMRPPGKAGRPSEWNNTANAGRIVSKPKRQEDSSCVFAWSKFAALATATIPQEKGRSPKLLRCRSEKRSFTKSRQDGAA